MARAITPQDGRHRAELRDLRRPAQGRSGRAGSWKSEYVTVIYGGLVSAVPEVRCESSLTHLLQGNAPLHRCNASMYRCDTSLYQYKARLHWCKARLYRYNGPLYQCKTPLYQCNASMYRYKASVYRCNGPLYQGKTPLHRYNASLHQFNLPMYRYRAPLHQCNASMYQCDASLYRCKTPLYQCNAACPRCVEASSSIGGRDVRMKLAWWGYNHAKKGRGRSHAPSDAAMDSSSYSAGASGTRATGVSSWSFFFLAAFSAFRPRNSRGVSPRQMGLPPPVPQGVYVNGRQPFPGVLPALLVFEALRRPDGGGPEGLGGQGLGGLYATAAGCPASDDLTGGALDGLDVIAPGVARDVPEGSCGIAGSAAVVRRTSGRPRSRLPRGARGRESGRGSR